MEENNYLPTPRICILNKPLGINEYGFDLHAEIGKGQFVGAVDIGSPAEISGLRPLDHILAVNEESIDGLSHKEVVQRIKSSSKGCSLLVLDDEGYIWAKQNNLSTEYFINKIKKEENNFEIPIEPKEFVEKINNSSLFKEEFIEEEESGSCSIGLSFTTTNNNSPFPSPQQNYLINSLQIPLKMGKEEVNNFEHSETQQQNLDEIKNNIFSSPSSTNSSPKFSEKKLVSPSSAAIGRHTAVPVLPPPSTLLANGPKPRLCLLIKGSPSQEFGFSLHAEGNGHFIGAVDSEGIAERAGLVTGQRIVGVNGHLIFPNTSHMDIVQLIQREPLRTELLVASEQVDRFYKEYGLSFSYDYIQLYDTKTMQNEKPPPLAGAAAVRSKHSPSALKTQNGGNYEKVKQRSRSGSRSVERKLSNTKNNGTAMRGRGQSLGKRPPTPSSTYLSSFQQSNGHVAVQIEKRSDNMTSIEIGEIEDSEPSKIDENSEQPLFGVGTPPSSRCEKKLKNGHFVQNGEGKISNGISGKGKSPEYVENSKHVLADGLDNSFNSTKFPPPIAAPRTPRPERRYSPPQPLEIYPPSQHQHYDISPLSLQSDSTQSSFYKTKDSEKSIFALNAKEARKAICGRKKDPRLMTGQMSLEEKYRLVMEL